MSDRIEHTIETLWRDRKRFLGMPLSFTRYRLSEDRIFCEKGFFNIHEEEILLYRVRDLELRRSLGQRIFGVGSVLVHSSDKTMPVLELKNIRHPKRGKRAALPSGGALQGPAPHADHGVCGQRPGGRLLP